MGSNPSGGSKVFNKNNLNTKLLRYICIIFKTYKMTQEEKNLETKFRIAFGIIILIVLGFALFSCKVEKVDCDAYSQQHMEQTDKTS